MPPDDTSYGVSLRDAQRIDRAVNHFERHALPQVIPQRQPYTPAQRLWYYAKTTQAISAATDTGTSVTPEVFTVDVWVKDFSSGSSPFPLIRTTDAALQGITVANYFPGLSHAGTGVMVEIEHDGDCWVLKGADC